MSLITPDFGLFFWMTIVFIIVLVILAKKGFPVITNMVEQRKAFIDASLENAHKANMELANVKKESESIIQEARDKQARILKEAAQSRETIIEEAQQKAREEATRIIEEARAQINNERQNAIKEAKGKVADISILIAEKILHSELSDSNSQMDFIDSILKDVSTQK